MALSYASSDSRMQPHSTQFVRAVFILSILSAILITTIQMFLAAPVALPTMVAASLDSTTLAFVPNAGQSAPQLHLQSTSQDASIFFSNNQVVLTLPSLKQADAAIAWQEHNGQRIPVSAAFVLEADQGLRFAFGAYNENELTVEVSDSILAASNTVTVNLNNVNDAPLITAGSFDLAENSPNASSVGTVMANDSDGSALSYSIIAGNTGAAFAINPTTGEITVANSTALDFETTPSFTLTVEVSDGSLNASNTVTINLMNVNEPPIIAAQTFSIAENSAAATPVGTVLASDPDADDTSSFAITAGNTNNAFAIDAHTGAITIATQSALDYETNPTFSLTITITDNGSLTASNSISINLTDVNDVAPVINSSSFDIAENSTNGTVAGAVSITDPDGAAPIFSIIGGTGQSVFAIDPTGTITVLNNTTLDYETNLSLTLDVQVSDGVHTVNKLLTINVTNINDNLPTITAPTDFGIAENSANGTLLGTAIIANDVDISDTLHVIIRAGNTSNAFLIDPTTKQLKVNNSAALNYEITPSFTLTIQVSDGSNTATDDVIITINDINEPPSIAAMTFSIAENSANDTSVGILTVSDPENAILTYTFLSGNTNNAFKIDAATKQLLVNNSAVLDYETRPSFNLSVQVSDAANTSSNTISIIVTDINDAPVLDSGGSLTLSPIAEDTPANTNTGTLISSIIGSSVSDQDVGAQKGIALIGAITTNGSWEFTLDGTTWIPIANVSDATALLLAADATTRLRFLPAANFNGIVDPAITFRAWDHTSGTNGNSNVNLGMTGGISAYSSATETASMLVIAVNDPPTAVNDQQTVEKNSSNNALDVLANDSIASDNGETIQITAVTAASKGTVQINATKDGLIYTPNAEYQGPDSFTYTITDSNGGIASAIVTVQVGLYQLMLPLIIGTPLAPDLEITSFTVTPAASSYRVGEPVEISVTIKNNGTIATGGFWVDLYINPISPPVSPNNPWEDNCGMHPCYGVAWLIEEGLAGGQSITLTASPANYYADNTNWPGFFASGTKDLYVYVDSWNGGVPDGAVVERNESNNRAELHGLQVNSIAPALNIVSDELLLKTLLDREI